MKSMTLRQSRDFGEIITDTFSYVRIHYRTLGKGLLFFSLPLIILSGILVGSGFGGIMANTDSPENLDEIAGMAVQLITGFILLLFTFLFIVIIVLKHIQLIEKGEEEIEIGMLLEGFARNFFGLIGILLITSFVTVIGAFFFILPGIFIAIKLSLAPAAYVIEECDFGDALSRSWELTKDYWWFTFGVQIVMSIIMNIISNVAIVPFYIILSVVVFSSGDPDLEFMSTLIGSMYGLIMIVVGLLYCFPIISQSMVYFNLEERKNGDSLFKKINSISAE